MSIENKLSKYRTLKDEVDLMELDIQKINQPEYVERLNSMLVELEYLEHVIRDVPDSRDRLILQKRYVECKNWDVICVEMNYCYRQICRVHNKIIQDLECVSESMCTPP